MSRLIGLHGYAGSGKDTAALALIEDGWVREAFADRMRTAILLLDPYCVEFDGHPVRLSWLVRDYGWDDAKRNYPEVRRLLQKFGTEAGRDIYGDSHWIDLVMDPWRISGDHDMVVTDVRYDDEAEAIRDAGGMVVEITRPGMERIPGQHRSEAGLSRHLIDAVIVNEGTVEELHRALRNIAILV